MKAAREYPIVTVTAKGTRWLESGHPWVYDSDVAREPEESECENGALVDVVSEKGKVSRHGLFEQAQPPARAHRLAQRERPL